MESMLGLKNLCNRHRQIQIIQVLSLSRDRIIHAHQKHLLHRHQKQGNSMNEGSNDYLWQRRHDIQGKRSLPPGNAGVSPAEIAAKMAALPGKGRGE